MKKLLKLLCATMLVLTLAFCAVACGDDTTTKNADVWEGSEIANDSDMEQVFNSETSTYEISKASQLAWISKQVNEKNVNFAGKTFRLTSNIDLNKKAWTPIGNVTSYPSKTFNGTFDGNGYTIYNLYATDAGTGSNFSTAALFGSVENATIKNLTISGAKIVSDHYASALVGYISSADCTLTIDNCSIINSTITSAPMSVGNGYDNGDKAGALVGYTAAGTNLVVTNCTISGVSVTAYRHIGGIAGYIGGDFTVNANTIQNVILTQDNTNGYKTDVSTLISEIAGNANEKSLTFGDNTIKNVQLINK